MIFFVFFRCEGKKGKKKKKTKKKKPSGRNRPV